jgi:hypothetical protein
MTPTHRPHATYLHDITTHHPRGGCLLPGLCAPAAIACR